MVRRYVMPSLVLTAIVAVALGLVYPLVMTGIGRVVFPYRANGSLIKQNGKVVGSALIGQLFAEDKYFHGRPSATNTPDPKDPTKTIDDVRELVSGARGRANVLVGGDIDGGIWSAGQSQGLIHDIPTCAELVKRIMAQAEDMIHSAERRTKALAPA